MQDHNGFIWFGTDAGLSRFDGAKFKNFTISDGLNNNDVLSLFQDTQNRIWITSLGRLCYYKDGQLITPKMPELIETASLIFSFVEDFNGHFWISTYDAIFRINQKFELLECHKHSKAMSLPGCRLFLEKDKQTIWAFTRGRAFYKILPKQKAEIYQHQIEDTFSPFSSLIDLKDSILFNSKNHLYVLPKKQPYRSDTALQLQIATTTPQPFVSNKSLFNANTTIHLLKDRNEELWISTFHKGLFHLKLERQILTPLHTYLPKFAISFGLQDRESNLWFTSKGKGVFFLPSDVNNIDHNIPKLTQTMIHAVHRQAGQLWLGMDRNRVAIFKDDKVQDFELPNAEPVSRTKAIDTFSDGTVLFGTDKGFYTWSKNRFKHHAFRYAIKDLQITADDKIVAATHKNVIVFSKKDLMQAKLQFPENQAIFNYRSTAVWVESTDKIWIGTPRGLFLYENGQIISQERQQTQNNFFRLSITDIKGDKQGNMWVATDGAGVAYLKDTNIVYFNTNHNLTSNICRQILLTDLGVIVGTNRGINIIKGNGDHVSDFTISSFDVINGLASNEILSLTEFDDNLAVGTGQGLSIIPKEALYKSTTPPILYISNMKIEERDTIIADHYDLNYYQNDFKIEFIGIAYKSMGQLSYRYRMLPNETHWTTKRGHYARYRSLKPGNYQFEVYTINKEGVDSEKTVITFHIAVPWWQTWWFLTLIVLLGMVALISTYRYVKTMIERQKLQKLVEQQNKDLNDQIKDLERSNDELSQFAHVVSHDLKEPLRTIASFLQLLQRRNRTTLSPDSLDYINFSIRGVKRMESIINDLLVFSQIDSPQDKKTLNINDVIQVVINNLAHKLESQQAQIIIKDQLPIIYTSEFQITQLFQNLIDNAIKYQLPDNKPIVKVAHEDLGDEWQFSIRDNGIGIDPIYQEKIFKMFQRLHSRDEFTGTGIGLAICKKIVLSNHGKIWFTSNKTGTTFYFTLKKEKVLAE